MFLSQLISHRKHDGISWQRTVAVKLIKKRDGMEHAVAERVMRYRSWKRKRGFYERIQMEFAKV